MRFLDGSNLAPAKKVAASTTARAKQVLNP
jgi:hypothetical protein